MRAVLASASSRSVLANDESVVVLAVPEPVKYGSASAALVRPAMAVNSASSAAVVCPVTRP